MRSCAAGCISGSDTPEDYAKAVGYFYRRRYKLDPDYGRAYAALAMVYILSYDLEWYDSLGLARSEARDTAKRYLREAEKHPTTLSHQVAAVILLIDLQPREALDELKEAAIAINSGDAFSYAYMGAALTASGRPAEAVPYIRTASGWTRITRLSSITFLARLSSAWRISKRRLVPCNCYQAQPGL